MIKIVRFSYSLHTIVDIIFFEMYSANSACNVTLKLNKKSVKNIMMQKIRK